MEGGAALFRKPLRLVYQLEGDIDGTKFNVSGEGTGNAETGTVEAKYTCTSGELPTDWVSIATTLAYGMKCFAKYPGGIKDMFKSCFPDGYTQDRVITHENDGVYKTHAEITYKDGVIYNKTKLKGEGFKQDGQILGKNLASVEPQVSYVIPDGKGIQVKTNNVYKLKTGGFQLASTDQTNQKLGFEDADVPQFHYLYSRILLSKDVSDVRDHIILKETVIATDPNVVEKSI